LRTAIHLLLTYLLTYLLTHKPTGCSINAVGRSDLNNDQ